MSSETILDIQLASTREHRSIDNNFAKILEEKLYKNFY